MLWEPQTAVGDSLVPWGESAWKYLECDDTVGWGSISSLVGGIEIKNVLCEKITFFPELISIVFKRHDGR